MVYGRVIHTIYVYYFIFFFIVCDFLSVVFSRDPYPVPPVLNPTPVPPRVRFRSVSKSEMVSVFPTKNKNKNRLPFVLV